MGGKTSTISNSAPAAGNLRIQTAVFGAAIAVIYGTTRVSGNLAWFGGFKAIPHTSTTTSGGKGGGGVRTVDTTYTYTAAVLMSLGEGVMNTVLSAWKGKTRYSGQPGQPTAVIRREVYTVPASGIVDVVYGGAGVFMNNDSVDDGLPPPWDGTPQAGG